MFSFFKVSSEYAQCCCYQNHREDELNISGKAASEKRISASKHKQYFDNFKKSANINFANFNENEVNIKKADQNKAPSPMTILTKKSIMMNKIKLNEPTNGNELSINDKTPEIIPISSSFSSKNIIPELDASPSKKESEDPSLPLARRLRLEVIGISALPTGTIINIDARGVIGSKRNINDGSVYFGTEIPNVIVNEFQGDHQVNDVIVPDQENAVGQQHFVIKFYPEKNGYFLKDLAEGTATFIRISKVSVLKKKNKITFGSIDFYANLNHTDTKEGLP